MHSSVGVPSTINSIFDRSSKPFSTILNKASFLVSPSLAGKGRKAISFEWSLNICSAYKASKVNIMLRQSPLLLLMKELKREAPQDRKLLF